ncbi:hypothetical protein BDY17DRAFT_152729 [Neohortaea acidophila]|uniref:Uncharacterized protein n=1 Tax=Neohortaea acidophila TaxID=245834 RepID=A0A6A6PVE7_9PEZI|nr:uncharacterized protein BDY17DRAFT_152729 [Neohortaea acidophila]KAF2483701.1 hypothetical protein BDY17DRAFT_152729 [Neohortaea acidophila]
MTTLHLPNTDMASREGHNDWPLPAPPHKATHRSPNVTTYELPSPTTQASLYHPLTPPVTPFFTFDQLRSLQPLPSFSALPGRDHKNVRRKKSYPDLARPSFASPQLSTPSTSSAYSLPPASSQTFHPTRLPPLPLTPAHRPRTKLPSLSSTIDTLPSTATNACFHRTPSTLLAGNAFANLTPCELVRCKL